MHVFVCVLDQPTSRLWFQKLPPSRSEARRVGSGVVPRYDWIRPFNEELCRLWKGYVRTFLGVGSSGRIAPFESACRTFHVVTFLVSCSTNGAPKSLNGF